MIDCKGMQGPRAPQDQPVAAEPALDRSIQGRIGSHLRAMYDELIQQPIPDHFIDLLANLERSSEEPPKAS